MDSHNAEGEQPRASKSAVIVEWIMPQHYGSVTELFNDCFSDQHNPMSIGRLEDVARQPRMLIVVASTPAERSIHAQHPCCAFIMFSKRRAKLILEAIAVHPARRRQGIGTALVACAKQQMNTTRPRIIAEAPDSNRSLETHLFLRACGFRAVTLLEGRDDREGLVVFEYHRDRESPFLYSPHANPIPIKNRISQ